MVDGAMGKEPQVEKDMFWNEITPLPLYTNGVRNVPIHKLTSSTPKPVKVVGRAIRSTFAKNRQENNTSRV